ncbi:MAG: hypothetical protein K0Q77_1329 [Anaerosporomusa subterranea]|jgi:hypothetical protein|nr:hypothetical protein [Anaerosporomusa subterranea]
MDFVAIQLEEAKRRLNDLGVQYSVEFTRPYSRSFVVDELSWYVVRQRQQADGSFCLLAAAKMGKEVF